MITFPGSLCVDGLLTRTRQPSRFASAAIIAALEGAWAAIRVRHPQIPPAVIVVAGSTTYGVRTSGLVLGHFAALRWQHAGSQLSEVLVSGEGLKRPAGEVFTTLLHEATHALAFTRGIKDTSRQGRWHNRRFADLANELGLTTSKDPKLGWSPSTLRPDTAEHYAPVLAELGRALTAYRHPEPLADLKTKNPSSVACTCGCPRRIRVALSVLALGPIACRVCEADFTPDEDLDPGGES